MHVQPEECVLDELQHQLARLEEWAETRTEEEEDMDLRWNLFEGDEVRPHRWRLQAAWHLERSVRSVPPQILEAGSQRGCSALLNELMMMVSISLSESAVASVALDKLEDSPADHAAPLQASSVNG
eukprot:g4379.t1